jgi:L-threonylcarbamoyladenylate synthase
MPAPVIIKINPECPDGKDLERAAEILRQGGVIAYPTETFYGLGVDTRNETAIQRLFAVKGRDFRNPIPVIIGSQTDLPYAVTEIPPVAQDLMTRFWPGPLTLIFAASAAISPRLTAGTGKIGIRVSSHPIARLLAQKLSFPLTSTSANRSGQQECITAQEVYEKIGADLDMIIDGGKTPGGKGSTIADITVFPPVVLRAGVISPEEIAE